MKKRIFSLMLALMLCLSLLPAAAFAAEDEAVGEPAQTVEPTEAPVTEEVTPVEPTEAPVNNEDALDETPVDDDQTAAEATETPVTDEEISDATDEPTNEPSVEASAVALDSAGETPPAGAVAEVTNNGQTSYPTSTESLIDFLKSSGTTYVKLLTGMTASGDITIESPNLTLDLNGCTLSISGNVKIGTGSSYSSAALTVTDSSAAKNGKLEVTGYKRLTVYNNDKLTVQSGAVSVKVSSVYGTMIVSGGTVSATDTEGISVYGTMTVSGGTVQGSVSCVESYSDGVGTVTITGGTVTSVIGKPGYLHLSGGTFGSVSCSGGSVSDLVGFLAADYAYFSKDTTGAYSSVTDPTTNAISDVQVKAHECEFELDSDARYTCKNGCGRSYAREPVPYLDENGVEQLCGSYTVLNDDYLTGKTSFDFTNDGNKETWFVVKENTTINIPCNMGGNAAPKLILCDNATLTVNKGILGFDTKSLTIYAQSTGNQMGKLAVTGGAKDSYGDTNGIAVETLTVNGGDITVNILPLGTGDVYGIYTGGAMTVNGGRISVTTGDVDGGENSIHNCGIYTYYALTVNGGTVTATAGNAKSKDSYAYSYGIYAYDYLTVNGGGTVTATGGKAESEDSYAYSYGIKAFYDFKANGSTVTATAGNAKSEDSYAYSYGFYANNDFIVNGGTVTATAGTAESEDGYAESYGIYADDDLTVNGGSTVTATGGKAESEDGYAESYGIYAGDDFKATGGTVKATANDAKTYSNGIYVYDMTVEGNSTVTATAGTAAEDQHDIYVAWDFILRSGTVQGGSDGAAVSVCAEPLAVSGGTIKLRDSYLYKVSVSEGVKLADLPAVGYAYWDTEVFLALSELEMLSELNYVYVKPCTMHSADDDEVCAYCGWDPSAVAPTAKPARSPQTGDEANILLWFGLMTVSMIGVAVVVGKKKAR